MSKLRIIGKTILEHYPNGFFSLDQIVRLTEISRKYVTDVLVVFSQEGLIRKIAKQRKEHIPGHSPQFTLTYRVVDRKALAARIAPKLKKETVQDRIWSVVQGKRFFTLRDLIALAEVKRESARWFLKMLRRAEIVKPLKPGGPGVVWALIRDPGSRPHIEIKRRAKGRGMNNKEVPKMGTAKRDKRVKILLSKAEAESVKRKALKLNLSTSAYLRMLMFRHAGLDEKTARAKACSRSS